MDDTVEGLEEVMKWKHRRGLLADLSPKSPFVRGIFELYKTLGAPRKSKKENFCDSFPTLHIKKFCLTEILNLSVTLHETLKHQIKNRQNAKLTTRQIKRCFVHQLHKMNTNGQR
jgi:hypothetical protein